MRDHEVIVTDDMVEAYQHAKTLAKANIQGFFFDGRHFIRDIRKKPAEQFLWEINDIEYDVGHAALIAEVERCIAVEAIAAAISHAYPVEERNRLREENERLRARGQSFANQVRHILYRLPGQEFATTVSELSAFDAALSQPTAEGREL